MIKIICPECGFSSEVSSSSNCGICSNCRELYMFDVAVKLGELGEIKTRKIKDYRIAQKESIKSENLTDLGEASVNLLAINPDDFLSKYYFAYVKRKLGDDSLIIDFLNEDSHIATEDQYEEIVNHVIDNCEKDDKSNVLIFLSNIDLPSKEFKKIKFLELFDSRYPVEETIIIEKCIELPVEEEEEVELSYEEKLFSDFSFCKDEANSNNVVAQRVLGYHYLYGEFTLVNEELGMKYLSVAADNGDEAAMEYIARDIIISNIVEKKEKCMKYLERLIEHDSSEGLFLAGKCYVDGIFVDIDYSIGVMYYKKSAAKNNASAQNNLADCFSLGRGVDVNIDKAIELWEMASIGGSGAAYYNLGKCYYDGDKVRQSRTKAFEYFKKGSELNHAECCYELSNCYSLGKGVKNSYNKANEYLELAISLGSADACFSKANSVYLDNSGREALYNKAISLYPNKISFKFALSKFYYWKNYKLDEGDFEVFNEALQSGYRNANFYLAECYYSGKGVKSNFSKAITHIKSFCGEYFDLESIKYEISYNTKLRSYDSDCKKLAKEIVKKYK